MATVGNREIFPRDPFKNAIEGAKAFLKIVKDTIKALQDVGKASELRIKGLDLGKSEDINKLNTEIAALTKNVKTLDTAQKEKSKTEKQINTLDKEQLKLNKKLSDSTKKRAQENAKLKVQVQENTKAAKLRARESLGLISIYERESTRLNNLRKQYKDTALRLGENSKEARKLQKEAAKLDTRLKRLDSNVGQFQRSVGNYGKAWQALGGVLRSAGVIGGIAGVVAVLRGGARVVVEFQQASSGLAAVLGKSRSEIGPLTNDAVRLGATTAKTATEVLGLQEAFARLGFAQSQILQLTEATINGSIALRAPLDQTANLVGAIVNSFDDFSAADAPQIIDQLTVSTQRSALNFEKLQKGIPIVAGAANAAGVPFTKLVALMGKLADAGIDVSTSSTAIRNIFIESAAQGLNYEQILDKIKGSQDKLTESVDAFGKRAAVSAAVLAQNIDATKDLEESINNAAGAAGRAAREELDTLKGTATLLRSAWEGFILSLENGDGVLARFINGTLKVFIRLLGVLTSETSTLSEETAKSQAEFNVLTDTLIRGELSIENRNRIMGEINDKYGDYLPNLITEKDSIDDIRVAQEAANLAFEKKIRLIVSQEKLIEIDKERFALEEKALELQKELTRAIDARDKIEKQFNEAKERASKTRNKADVDDLGRLLDGFNKEQVALDLIQKEIDETTASQELLNESFDELIDKLGVVEKKKKGAEEDIDSAREKMTIIEDQKKAQKELLDILIQVSEEGGLIGKGELRDQRKIANERIKLLKRSLKEAEKQRDFARKRELEAAQEQGDKIAAIADATNSLLQKRTEDQLNDIDKKLSDSQRRQEEIQRAIEQGSEAAKESLTQARAEEEKLQAERERAIQKEKRQQAILALLKTYSAKVAAGDPNALGSTINDASKLIAFVSSLPAFREGTELVKDALDPTMAGRDGHIVRVDGDERIMTGEQNKMLGNISNDNLASLGMAFNKGNLIPNADLGLKDELQNITAELKALPGNMPVSKFDYDAVNKMISDSVQRGNNTHVTRTKNQGAWA